jgi:endogenous inhibitor of DNA gyrase (YacG/DUF329 family)
MSYQDVRGHYDERDDHDDPPPVEIVTVACPGCGKPVRVPVDADGDDECCSRECIAVVCARMDADVAAWQAAEVAEMEARMRAVPCPECGTAFRCLPGDEWTCCSAKCRAAHLDKTVGGHPPTGWDDLPL